MFIPKIIKCSIDIFVLIWLKDIYQRCKNATLAFDVPRWHRNNYFGFINYLSAFSEVTSFLLLGISHGNSIPKHNNNFDSPPDDVQ